MNGAAAETLGGKAEDFVGKSMWDLFPPEVADMQMNEISKAIESGRLTTSEKESVVRGQNRWYFARIQPLQGPDGTFNRALVILADVTDRKEAEEEARRHQSELAHVWRVNTMGEMASGLAHELNQPLCAILNYANVCLRTIKGQSDPAEDMTEAIEEIASQTERAGQIIKRIRGLVAKRRPHTMPVDINQLVKEVVELEKNEAIVKKITVRTALGKNLPTVMADRVEIEEVILNLVRNAFDAMSDAALERCEVTITTRKKKGMLEICVRDTGKGIGAVGQHIFDSFFTTKTEGLGIGLSISRTIVELHGGKLWAEDNADCGASFKFTLPLEQS
jgi:PAS domain S-box-containing protein